MIISKTHRFIHSYVLVRLDEVISYSDRGYELAGGAVAYDFEFYQAMVKYEDTLVPITKNNTEQQHD